jgi:hypothetical protein
MITKGQPYLPQIQPLYPLNIPMSVSGCFGDLRTNSLHFGIDFRTKSKTGFPVFATDSGYVSRIKIEPGGYGRAIYITHRNGWVSVYGHLEKLRGDLEQYCKIQQYNQMQFGVDLFPGKDSILINRGDTIGLSGNAGASTGPHLHFEFRDEKKQIPVNIFRYFNFPVQDTVAPVIEKLWVYPKGDLSQVNCLPYKAEYPVIYKNDSASLENNQILYGWRNVAFGIEVYDPGDKTNNKTGVYSIDLWDNDSLIFNQTFDKFSFSEQRYVNSMIDYEYFISTFKRINKLFIQPNNKLSIYKKNKNNGIVSVTDTLKHIMKIVVKDANQNKTELIFTLKGDSSSLPLPVPDTSTIGDSKKILCQSDQVYTGKNIKVFFSPNSLYEDLKFQHNIILQIDGLYSDIHQIHNKYTPIHQYITLRITPNNLPEFLKDKAVIAYMDKKKPVWGNGNYKNGYVETYIRQFGDYAITVDTIAPIIKPLFKVKKYLNFKNENQIAFKITDNLSGIYTYQGFIDGNWSLFEYDAKQDLIYYIFDKERMTFGSNHQLLLLVTDAKENCSEYSTEFYK